MKKFGRRFLGISALALSLLVSVPANAEELTNTEQPQEEIVVDVETPDETEDVAMTTNGWVKDANGYYYYYTDGVMANSEIKYINGNYYYFNAQGIMMDNTSTMRYDDNGVAYYCCAKKGGALYSGEWCGNTYYMVGGRSASGITEINGRYYYFNNLGQLITSGQVTVGGVTYNCNSAGVLVEYKATGWEYKSGKWYYRQDGTYVTNTIIKLGNKYYGFNSSGAMYSGTTFYMNSKSYRANLDGSLVTGWYNGTDDVYYYDETGAAVNGTVTIDGKEYYFKYNVLATEGYYKGEIVNGGLVYWIMSSDNTVTKISGKGWHKVGTKWYYIKENGSIAEGEIVEINGKKYYFKVFGMMLANESVSTNGNGIRAKANGELYRNTWYNTGYAPNSFMGETDAWVYYGDDCYEAKGLATIDGKTYLFATIGFLSQNDILTYDGVLYKTDRNGVATAIGDGWHQDADGKWAYVQDGKLLTNGAYVIDGKTYYFKNSRMETGNKVYYNSGKYYILNAAGQVVDTPGWYQLDGKWYYINEDSTLYRGLLTVNGYTYYLEPEMVCNKSLFYYSDTLYKVNGAMGTLTPITADGIYSDGEDTYCISDGVLYEGWKKEGNNWYYYNPQKVMNGSVYDDGEYYYFDAQGKLYTNTWILNSYDSPRYAKSSGVLAKDEKLKIDGKTYYFDSYGYLYEDATEYTKLLDYTYYDVNNKPVTVSFKNGWNSLNGKYYYVMAGEVIRNQDIVINGKYYSFDTYGIMRSNEKYKKRIYGKDGAALTGWVQWGGDWYYADTSTALLATGLRRIGQYEYFFEYDERENYHNSRVGIMCTTEAVVNGYKYIFNANGTIKKIVNPADNGWMDVNGEPTYFKDGYPYTGWVGDYYVEYGKKIIDSTITWNGNSYYLDQNGKYYKSKWRENYDGAKRFYKSSGAAAKNEWVTIGGKWYYFDDKGIAAVGMRKIGSLTYYFDNNGKMVTSYKTLTAGWNQVDGKWFYVQDGDVLMDGTHYIKGKWYSFENGIMVTNETVYDSGNYYRYNSNGVRESFTGWQKINGKWSYFDANGNMCRGWVTVGGKKYYLEGSDEDSNAYMLTGTHILGNYKCKFDANGVLQELTALNVGWQSIGGKWYYVDDTSYGAPSVLRYDMVKLGDNCYFFDEDGVMLTNRVVKYNGVMYYHGADGKAVRKAGIYTDSDGKSVYVTSDGRAHLGDVYINGVLKFMDAICNYNLTVTYAY